MQKEADALLATERTQFSRQGDEVIVVHPDDVVVLQQRFELAREHPVHALVASEIAGVEVGQIKAVVKHRPEHAVGVTLVVGVVVVAVEIHRCQRDAARGARVKFAVAFGCVLVDVATPAKPESSGALQ